MFNHTRLLNRLACVLALATMAGCTSVRFPRQDLSPAAAARLKDVALLRIDEPDQLEPPIFANAALGALGPLGVIAVGAILMKQVEERTGPFTEAMHKEEASFADLLAAGITSAASSRGLEIKYLPASRPVATAKDKFDYGSIPQGAETLLHVKLDTLGCRHDSSFGGNCFPIVQATVRLIEAKSGNLLARRTIRAGHGSVQRDIEVIADGQEPSFENYTAVMASPQPLAEALRARTRALASHIASMLRAEPSPRPAKSAASQGSADSSHSPLLSSWIVTVDGSQRTRTFAIRKAERLPNGTWSIAAVYGYSDGGQGPVKCELEETGSRFKLSMLTRAGSTIVAESDDALNFVGAFTPQGGIAKPVTFEKMSR
jgi:hypothetical protein